METESPSEIFEANAKKLDRILQSTGARLDPTRFSHELHISPFETSDLSQIGESLEAAAKFFGFEPVLENHRYFTATVTGAEKKRNQRDAASIILSAKESLAQQSEPRQSKNLHLLVSNQDLFALRMNFVFGLANSELGIAVMSTYRLTKWTEDLTPSQIQERVLKEASHEIGHLIGLAHCKKNSCMMSFSENLEQVDLKLPLLCGDCSRKIGLK